MSFRQAYRGTLFGKYAAYLMGAVSVVLLASGLADFYFSQQQLRILVARLQQEKAESVAHQIESLTGEFRRQLELLALRAEGADLNDLQQESLRLLRLVPAISHLRVIDDTGSEVLFISRFDLDRIGSGQRASGEPGFDDARSGDAFFSPVYFRKQTEPYATIAVPQGRSGAVAADVNLKPVWDVVSRAQLGESGYAYVIDRSGALLAHPNTSLVLRNTNIASSPLVAGALGARAAVARGRAGGTQAPTGVVGVNLAGTTVLSAHHAMDFPGWTVFVEQPLTDAYAPVYASMARTLALMLCGLVLAVLLSLHLARRMVNPVQALREGVQKLEGGALGHRIEIKSGDELETLANQFNAMARRLQESHATLERKIEDRTRDLALANTAKTRFLAVASHDLRQPIYSLGLLLFSLAAKVKAPELRATIAQAEATVETLEGLLDSLLDISKLDSNAVRPDIRDFELGPILQRIVWNFGPEIHGRGLRLRFVNTRAVVRSDPVMLTRVLANLVSNANRYTPRGKLLIGCRRLAGRVRIEVHDTGIGILPEHREAIFGEFFRVEGAAPAERAGLGLGLSIVRRLCALLGHGVEVRSSPGRGSTFSVVVPLAAAQTDLSAGPAVTRAPNAVLKGQAILIVDDDDHVRDGLQRMLAGFDCTVFVASTAQEAIGCLALNGGSLDIVLCDYHLAAGETGLQVLAALRSAARKPFPAILMSGDTDPELERLCRNAGYPLLRKPVRPERLLALMGAAEGKEHGSQGSPVPQEGARGNLGFPVPKQ